MMTMTICDLYLPLSDPFLAVEGINDWWHACACSRGVPCSPDSWLQVSVVLSVESTPIIANARHARMD